MNRMTKLALIGATAFTLFAANANADYVRPVTERTGGGTLATDEPSQFPIASQNRPFSDWEHIRQCRLRHNWERNYGNQHSDRRYR